MVGRVYLAFTIICDMRHSAGHRTETGSLTLVLAPVAAGYPLLATNSRTSGLL